LTVKLLVALATLMIASFLATRQTTEGGRRFAKVYIPRLSMPAGNALVPPYAPRSENAAQHRSSRVEQRSPSSYRQSIDADAGFSMPLPPISPLPSRQIIVI
jgi:hypothetical protein